MVNNGVRKKKKKLKKLLDYQGTNNKKKTSIKINGHNHQSHYKTKEKVKEV
jgi:hypothetical protein